MGAACVHEGSMYVCEGAASRGMHDKQMLANRAVDRVSTAVECYQGRQWHLLQLSQCPAGSGGLCTHLHTMHDFATSTCICNIHLYAVNSHPCASTMS